MTKNEEKVFCIYFCFLQLEPIGRIDSALMEDHINSNIGKNILKFVFVFCSQNNDHTPPPQSIKTRHTLKLQWGEKILFFKERN